VDRPQIRAKGQKAKERHKKDCGVSAGGVGGGRGAGGRGSGRGTLTHPPR